MNLVDLKETCLKILEDIDLFESKNRGWKAAGKRLKRNLLLIKKESANLRRKIEKEIKEF